MISDVAELLVALSQAEAAKLAKSDITHAPTIGAMYEGLTRDILDRAVPPGLGLQVVDGFVVDGQGGRSGQIDGMLVRGQGVPVPFTGQFEWHVKDVLAVFEVKKTLTAANLADAYDQMAGVMVQFNAWYQDALFTVQDFGPSFHTYAGITGQIAPPADQWEMMDRNLGNILYTLRAEQFAPLRIVFGYGGYKTERGLRGAFLDYLETKKYVAGYAPLDMPSLIVGEGASLLKLGGFPYWAPLTPTGEWMFLASSRINPIRLMLELIWTKISLAHDVVELFGDDLDVEVLPALLSGQIIQNPDGTNTWGWNYKTVHLSKPKLDKIEVLTKWNPAELDAFTFELLTQCSIDGVDLDDADIQADIADSGLSEIDVTESLLKTHLVALNGRRIELIARELLLVVREGRYLAAENNTGRFSRWLGENQVL